MNDTKPAVMTASRIVQATMAAAFLVGVTGAASAQAVIKDDGGLVQWTIGMNGVSSASGVSAVNLSGLNYFWGPGSASNGSVSEVVSSPWTGGVRSVPLDLPSSGSTSGPAFFVDSYGESGKTGTATLTLPAAQTYFGALINSETNTTNTVSFYNDSALVDCINVTDLGTFFPSAVLGGSDYASYLNVDFLGSTSFNKVVITETGGTTTGYNGIILADISTSSAAVSLTSLTSNVGPTLDATPLPAFGGTSFGLLALAGAAFRGLWRGKLRTACPASMASRLPVTRQAWISCGNPPRDVGFCRPAAAV